MNKLILIMTIIPMISYSNPFKNSFIERKLENGKVQKFDGNEYMIVRKKSPEEIAKQKAFKESELAELINKNQKTVIEERVIEKVIVKEAKKNSFKGFIGRGPNELEKTRDSVNLVNDNMLGIGYERMLNDKLSIEAIGTTNDSLLIGAGYHF